MPRKFLTAEWQDLIMANYIISPEILIPFLPAKTELDYYNGNTYVSLVGFMFANTKVMENRSRSTVGKQTTDF